MRATDVHGQNVYHLPTSLWIAPAAQALRQALGLGRAPRPWVVLVYWRDVIQNWFDNRPGRIHRVFYESMIVRVGGIPVRVSPGEAGLLAVGLATSNGEVVLRAKD